MMINNFIEQLTEFLELTMEKHLSIIKSSKWTRNNLIKLELTVRSKNGFATIEECATIHKAILMWIKKEDIQKKIQISVSSESINKNLITRDDYIENIGNLIKIELKEKINERKHFSGFLNDVKNDTIHIKSDKEEINIIMSTIKKAQIMLINKRK